MEDKWNNVEMVKMTKSKSYTYTLNHDYDKRITEVNEKPNCLIRGEDIKPQIGIEEVECLLIRLYGISIAEIKELISYDDRNYFIKVDSCMKNPFVISPKASGYVFKILNRLDSKNANIVTAQNHLLFYLLKYNIECPRPVANANGKYYSLETISSGEHIIRLLEFVPGKLFHEIPKNDYLLYQSGEYLAKLDNILKNFYHEAYDTHTTIWQLQSLDRLSDFVYIFKDDDRKEMVEDIIRNFQTTVLNRLNELPQQIIHGDYNEQNIIVRSLSNSYDCNYEVNGIIDFGDSNKSPLIFEVGIAITYVLLQKQNLDSGGIFLAGFESILPFTVEEKKLLKYCVAARLAQSLTLGAYTFSINPTNEYVLVTQEQGWKLLQELWCQRLNEIDDIWKLSAEQYLNTNKNSFN